MEFLDEDALVRREAAPLPEGDHRGSRLRRRYRGRRGEPANLSQQRSENVARQLMLLGIRKHQLVTSGFASEIPAASNETAKGRKSNRRVEVTVR